MKGHLLNSVRTSGSDPKFVPAVPLGSISIPLLGFHGRAFPSVCLWMLMLKHLPEQSDKTRALLVLLKLCLSVQVMLLQSHTGLTPKQNHPK